MEWAHFLIVLLPLISRPGKNITHNPVIEQPIKIKILKVEGHYCSLCELKEVTVIREMLHLFQYIQSLLYLQSLIFLPNREELKNRLTISNCVACQMRA